MKKCFYFLSGFLLFFSFLTISKADSYKVKSFNFLSNTENVNYATIGLYENETRTGRFGLYVNDMSETKPYANFYIATGNAMLPETFSSSDMTFMIQKTNSKYNYGGYMLDVYVVQVNLLTGWNCSVQGLNCTWTGTFSMKNFYNYQTPSRIFSVTTTDERMNPSADVNVNINLDGIINEQDKTNNKLDEIKDQNTEAEKTRKGIWGTIKEIFTSIIELPGKIINLLIDALKSLFIPSDDFFENFINDFKDKFLNKLGFLAYPFELIADILDRYMNIASDPVINIPQINEPFTGGKLIEATSVNLKEIFEYGAIGTMYGIYRSCVSVIIIVMFLNFAIKKYDEFVKNKGSDS